MSPRFERDGFLDGDPIGRMRERRAFNLSVTPLRHQENQAEEKNELPVQKAHKFRANKRIKNRSRRCLFTLSLCLVYRSDH